VVACSGEAKFTLGIHELFKALLQASYPVVLLHRLTALRITKCDRQYVFVAFADARQGVKDLVPDRTFNRLLDLKKRASGHLPMVHQMADPPLLSVQALREHIAGVLERGDMMVSPARAAEVVAVQFECAAPTQWGQRIVVCGNSPALGLSLTSLSLLCCLLTCDGHVGDWDPRRGLALEFVAGVWLGRADVSAAQPVRYKYVMMGPDDACVWERDGPDRLAYQGGGLVQVRDTFGEVRV
jgi:hypothetical protein